MLVEGDEELNSLIFHYSVLELAYDDPEKHCNDCVDSMKLQNHAKRMKALIGAVKQAEARGDTAEVARLLDEQNELSKQRTRRMTGGES